MMLTLKKKKTLNDFFCGPAPYSEDPCCTALRCRIRINLKYKQIDSIFNQGVNGDLWPLNAGTALPERAHRSGTSSESLHLLEQQHPSVRIPFDTWKQSYLVHQFECVTSTDKIKQKKKTDTWTNVWESPYQKQLPEVCGEMFGQMVAESGARVGKVLNGGGLMWRVWFGDILILPIGQQRDECTCTYEPVRRSVPPNSAVTPR